MNVLRSIISLTILAVASSNPIAAPAPSTSTTCDGTICMDGHEPFICRTRRLVCCKGRTNNSFQVFTQTHGFECCAGAGELYDTQREICVSGQVRSRNQNEYNCGPDKTYDTSDQVCCGTNVYSIIPGAQCCGDAYLTSISESCCNGNIRYNIYEQVCCRRLENDPDLGPQQLFDIPYGQCCQEKPYDKRNQSCVNTDHGLELIDKESRHLPRCSFNGESYDPTTQGCCRGESTTVYELRRMLCHHGRLYEKTPRQNSVCEYTYIDDLGRLQTMVIPYTKNSRTGCTKTGVVTLGPSQAICGDQIYNNSTDLCCSGKVHAEMKIEGFQCCLLGGTKRFNPEREICCFNEVTKRMKYNDGARCCHREPYSPKTHECSGGAIAEKGCPSYGDKCNVSVPILKRMKKHYVYFGIVGQMTQAGSSRRSRVARQWTIKELKTLKFKKGKVTVVNTKSKGTHFLKSTECGCPQNLAAGERYMFVSSKPIKRKTLSLESANNGFIISIEDKQQIGLVFETIIEKSK